MQDNPQYSYISTVITPDNATHYIKDTEARDAITNLENNKQDKITTTNKLAATLVSGLATVATSGSYDDLTNKPTIPAGVTVDTAISSTSTNPVQNKVVKSYVDTQISNLGSVLNYKGTKTSESAIKAITSAKVGDVWINTADNSEWVCKENISAAKASAWEKLGSTIDLSEYAKTADLGEFAFVDEGYSSFTPRGSVTVDAYKPEGSIAMNNFTPAGSISVGTGTANYTPAGSVTVSSYTPEGSVVMDNYTPEGSIAMNNFTPAGSISVGTGTANYTPAGSVTVDSYTPEGTVSTPTITVTPNTTTVNSITNVGTLPSFGANVENETLTLTFSAGTLPTKGANVTVATGIKSATSTQPTFTGTAKAPTGSFSGTGARLKFTGTAAKPTGTFTGTAKAPTGSFTGTAKAPTASFGGTGVQLKFTGTAAKPTGSFTGTSKAPTATFTGIQELITVTTDDLQG